jgi:hypothetical protein
MIFCSKMESLKSITNTSWRSKARTESVP